MPSAFILLNTAIGKEKDVLLSLRKNKNVEAFAVQSVYDVVVKVKAETFDSLKETIARIKRTLFTHSSVTMLTLEEGIEQPTVLE